MAVSGTVSTTIAGSSSSQIITTFVVSPAIWEAVEQTHVRLPERSHMHSIASHSSFLAEASKKTGNAVIISPQYNCLPVLLGSDGEVIPLYELVEEWDAITDYDEIQERFPTLSYMQVAGAVAFIRKITQFNADQMDIDAVLSHKIESDPDFQQELRSAIADREITRVLIADE